MKGILYILESEKGRYYVGSTTDIERRMKQHYSNHTSTTKRMGKVKLVLQQEFESIEKARVAESIIKSWKRKDFIKKVIDDGIFKKLK